MLHLALIYSGLVFCAVAGVLQAAAAYNNLKGMLFFKKKVPAYIFAGLTIGFSLFVFFVWNYRYPTGMIEGSQQAGYFALATAVAVIFTLILSAIIKDSSLKERSRRSDRPGFFQKSHLVFSFPTKIAE